MIMIENYLYGTIWKYFMKNEFVLEGIKNIGMEIKNSIYIYK